MRKLTRNGLIKKNWEKCRLIKFNLVGRKCELCGSEQGLEVDHCFTRNNKKLFYMIPNLTVLCSSCHSHKTYHRHAMDLKVYEHVETREGTKTFNEMRKIDEELSPFPDWQYFSFHEDESERLQSLLGKEDSHV